MKRNLLLYLVFGFLFMSRISAQDEAFICKYLFSSSDEITQLSKDAISIAVDAVWEASSITGVITTTGTLTQSQINPDIWTYSPNPGDKLIVNFANGASIVFTFYSINGYTGGTAEDFKWSHLMDFNTFVQNQINIRINSNTYPQGGKIYWQRAITGTALFDSQNMSINISHTGNIDYDISSGYAYYKYTEQVTGSSNTGSFSVNINEGYVKTIINNSNTSVFVINTEILNNSSGNFNGTLYQFQNANVFWAAASVVYGGYYNKVIDAHQWFAQGTMIKNGQVYGNLQFDSPVINDTNGPDLILHLNNGNNLFLHTLINFPITGLDDEKPDIKDFILLQNYPNPFNPFTVIQYSINTGAFIQVNVYDALGREIKTLINEGKPSGTYQVIWDANNLPSGIYFCRLQANSLDGKRFVKTIKMNLLK